jgi:heme oxygenase
MDRLRQSTTEAHQRAESSPLMRAIGRGTVARERYITHLEQLLLVHRALEGELDRVAQGQPSWSVLALGDRRRVPDLTADLEVLGGSLTPAPLAETAAAQTIIRQAGPFALLGMFYVTEGSTNGGRFLVKQVAKGLGLDLANGRGLRAQNPYGDRQPALWAEFKAAMNALTFSAAETAELEAGARTMFDLLATIAEAIEPEVARD